MEATLPGALKVRGHSVCTVAAPVTLLPPSLAAVTKKTRVLDVVYNASNNELVRTKTLVKNCIIQIDATPFRQWSVAACLAVPHGPLTVFL